jgi:hypothetical protein
LGATLAGQRDLALLFKDLATLRTSAPVDASAKALRWVRPSDDFVRFAQYVGAPELVEQATSLATGKASA